MSTDTSDEYPDLHPFHAEVLKIARAMIPPAPDPAKEEKNLRDYFAAHALIGLLGHNEVYRRPHKAAAEEAFQYADAMMKARGA